MSSALLNMSLDQAIQQRKASTKATESKNKARKARANPIKKTRADRKKTTGSKPTRTSTKRSDSRKRPDTKVDLKNKFIKRTGAGAPATKKNRKAKKERTSNKKVFTTKSSGAVTSEASRKIKISNLDFNVTHSDLMELFSKLGTVTKNKIVYDDLGRSKGKAFVEFEKSEVATSAIKEYDGVLLDGKTIHVEYDVKPVSTKNTEVSKKRISKDRSLQSFKKGSFRDGSRRGEVEKKGGRKTENKGGRREGDRKPSRNNKKKSFGGKASPSKKFKKMVA